LKVTEHTGSALRYLAIEPEGYDAGRPYPLVVLLHGFGSHMADLAALAPAIDRQGYVYVCPNAPLEMQVGFGGLGYAWTPPRSGATAADVERAMGVLDAFLSEAGEAYGAARADTVLGGFSQCGLMTYLCGLTSSEPFRGLAVLSGVSPDLDALRPRLAPGRSRAIFVAHGTGDTMVSVDEARTFRRSLEEEGYAPEYREYDMGHEISAEVLRDLVAWLRRVLPPLGR